MACGKLSENLYSGKKAGHECRSRACPRRVALWFLRVCGGVRDEKEAFHQRHWHLFRCASLFFARGVLLRVAYGRAKKIFCISAYTKMQLKEAGISQSKLEVVHLGTSDLPKASEQYIQEVRESNNIPDAAYPIILTVG